MTKAANQVLLLDDNADLLAVLVPLLEMNGFMAEAHTRPDSAIQALGASPWHAVVFCAECDERNGSYFSLKVAALLHRPAVLLAYASGPANVARLSAQGIHVLPKPLDFGYFLAALHGRNTLAAGCQNS